MAGPFLVRDGELAAKIESAWGTDPTVGAADFFKHTSSIVELARVVARHDRDQDRDGSQASVITTHKGREHSTWSVACDLIPSGNAATITAPDVDPFIYAHLGDKHAATAHTTTAAGSVGASLVLTAGGGAASGVAVGDIIAVDVSAAVGYEARQVTAVATDTLTIDRAFTADPATGRTVKLGTTYHLSEAALRSVWIQMWLDGDNHRWAVPGAVVQNLGIELTGGQDTPVCKFTTDGVAKAHVAHTTARPTPTTAGVPLVPTAGLCWIGATAVALVNCNFKSNTGLALRMNEINTLAPTGVKRTENSARYSIQQQLDMLLLTGTVDGFFTNAAALTAYDVLVQLGVAPGSMVVWRTPKFVPDAGRTEIDGEVGLSLTGRCYGTAADDEISLAFI